MNMYVKYEVSGTADVAAYPMKENYQNGCHLKNVGHNDFIFDVHILGAYEHICTKYEVSMFKSVARKGVHR